MHERRLHRGGRIWQTGTNAYLERMGVDSMSLQAKTYFALFLVNFNFFWTPLSSFSKISAGFWQKMTCYEYLQKWEEFSNVD